MKPIPHLVVTGATGQLGRALLARLAALQVPVTGVSRRASAGLVSVNEYRDSPAGDVLIHLAEAGNAYEAEAASTLQALLGKGFRRVVYASSALLYGDHEIHPRGRHEPVEPFDAYTRIKRHGELAVLAAGGVAVRLTNVYGPGMSSGNVVSAILSQVPGEGPVVVLDDKPVRDFIWADDAADALATIALGDATGLFNVGSGAGTSVRQLAALALAAVDESYRPVVARAPAARHSHLVVDIEPTVSAFGWRPSTSVQTGIRTLLTNTPPQR